MLDLDVAHRRGEFLLEVKARLAGPVTGIFGPSGAGKTTLLHLVAGLLRPGRGRIALDGVPLTDAGGACFVPPHRRRIGMVFQEGRLFPHLTVHQNLRFGERYAPVSERRLDFDTVVDLLDLGRLLERPAHAISGGEAQRTALGRALLTSPRLLLMDEPLASLDRGLKGQILPFFRRVREVAGIPMLYVSHDLGEILQLTSTLAVLKEGRLVAAGCLLDLLEHPEAVELLRGHGLLNVIRARVLEVRAADAMVLLSPLTEGAASGAARAVIRGGLAPGLAPGEEVSLSLRPEDVALSGARVEGTSIQNQLEGVVRSVVVSPRRTLVVVEAGFPLVLEVTHHAAHELALAPGRTVVCLFKAQAVRYLEGGGVDGASGP